MINRRFRGVYLGESAMSLRESSVSPKALCNGAPKRCLLKNTKAQRVRPLKDAKAKRVLPLKRRQL